MDYFATEFYDLKDALVIAEMQILKRLGFQTQCSLPYGYLVNYAQVLELTKHEDVVSKAWGYVNDMYVVQVLKSQLLADRCVGDCSSQASDTGARTVSSKHPRCCRHLPCHPSRTQPYLSPSVSYSMVDLVRHVGGGGARYLPCARHFVSGVGLPFWV